MAMKALFLCLLFLCPCAAARAQAAPAGGASQGPPDLSVVKYSWSKERINWEGDPFGGPVESFDDMRRRRADERRVERARAAGNIGEANKVEREMRSEQVIKSRAPAPPRYAFLYKATVRNAGGRTVKELDWDYVFFDAATGQELGRRMFASDEKIGPGKSKELSFTISSPPTQRISAQALDRREREGLSEQVVIVRILYDDGTVWERQN